MKEIALNKYICCSNSKPPFPSLPPVANNLITFINKNGLDYVLWLKGCQLNFHKLQHKSSLRMALKRKCLDLEME